MNAYSNKNNHMLSVLRIILENSTLLSIRKDNAADGGPTGKP